jgi:hypothetical protein
VWADEFDGDDLDYRKWEKEENNYGGGNNERQAYRTDPKYCFVKDGVLNLAVYRDAHTTPDGKDAALLLCPNPNAEAGGMEIRTLRGASQNARGPGDMACGLDAAD